MTSKFLFLSLATMALLSANAAPDRFGWQKEYLKNPSLNSPNFHLDRQLSAETLELEGLATLYKTEKNYSLALNSLAKALDTQLSMSETCHLYVPFNIHGKTKGGCIKALTPLIIYFSSEIFATELHIDTQRRLRESINDIVKTETLLLKQRAEVYISKGKNLDAWPCLARALNNELRMSKTAYLYEKYQLDERSLDKSNLENLVAHLRNKKTVITKERRFKLLDEATTLQSLLLLLIIEE